MADWSKPTITSNYVTFVDEAKARDVDAITLTRTAITNPPVGSVKLLRTPIAFQEWTGAEYGTLVLSIDGGGTGGYNAPMARNNLGLGTMSLQNSNTVAITGGTLSGIAIHGLVHYGVATYNGSGGNAIVINASAGSYGLSIGAANHGIYIRAGATPADYAFICQNAVSSLNGLIIYGNMIVSIPTYLTIPLGPDRWAPA